MFKQTRQQAAQGSALNELWRRRYATLAGYLKAIGDLHIIQLVDQLEDQKAAVLAGFHNSAGSPDPSVVVDGETFWSCMFRKADFAAFHRLAAAGFTAHDAVVLRTCAAVKASRELA